MVFVCQCNGGSIISSSRQAVDEVLSSLPPQNTKCNHAHRYRSHDVPTVSRPLSSTTRYASAKGFADKKWARVTGKEPAFYMPDKCDLFAKKLLDIKPDGPDDCVAEGLALPFRRVWIVMHRGELHPEGGVRTMGASQKALIKAATAGHDLVMSDEKKEPEKTSDLLQIHL